MNTFKYKHGIMDGKFSPCHKGHRYDFRLMSKECEHYTIIVGSAQEENTKKIPFSLDDRLTMVSNCVKKDLDLGRVKIIALPDINDLEKWGKYVLDSVKERSFEFPVDVYYGGDIENTYPFLKQTNITVSVLDREIISVKNNFKSGTELREMIRNNDSEVFKFIPQNNWLFIRSIM